MHDPRVGRFFAVDPLEKDFPWNSPYAFSENVVINAIELEGLEKLIVTGENDSKWNITYGSPKSDKVDEIKLSDYGINYDIGNKDIALGVESIPDVVGLDINVSVSGGPVQGETGINLLWHPTVNGESLAPEIHAYYGGGASLKDLMSYLDIGASATASVLWGYAYNEKGGRASNEYIKNGINWTGNFYNRSLTFGEAYVITFGQFSGVPYFQKPVGEYWKGNSVGFGVGVSLTAGTSKLAKGIKSSFKVKNFKDIITKASFMPIDVQNYFMIYGNGGEIDDKGNDETGWHWFYQPKK